VLLGLEEVGVGAPRVGLATESEQCRCGCQPGPDGVAVGEGDGAACYAEAEGGERAPPGRPGEPSELVCGVGEGFAPVEKGLFLVGLGQRGSVADELPEVAGVRAVLVACCRRKSRTSSRGTGARSRVTCSGSAATTCPVVGMAVRSSVSSSARARRAWALAGCSA